MDDRITFLVPHAGNPAMLAACLASIRTHHDATILVGLRDADPYAKRAAEIADAYFVEDAVITSGNGDDTERVMGQLLANCDTEYAVYMEADCLLLRTLRDNDLSGFFTGVEDVIPWPEDRPGNPMNGSYFRYSPGMHSASFFILRSQDYKSRFGLETIPCGREPGRQEPYMGLSMTLNKAGVQQTNLQVRSLTKRYGFAMQYGDLAIHAWFGGWRLRDNVESASGVPREYLHQTQANLLEDFWQGTLCTAQ